MQYKLTLMNTQAGVGCFSAMPGPNLSLNQVLDHLRAAPLDEFMYQHLITRLGELRFRKVEQFLEKAMEDRGASDPVPAAALYEAVLTHPRLEKLRPRLAGLDPAELGRHAPTIRLRAATLADRDLHRAWMRALAPNLTGHEPLPDPAGTGLDQPVEPSPDDPATTAGEVRDQLELENKLPPENPRRPVKETVIQAMTAINETDCAGGTEMAHKACLAPHALLRHWIIDVRMRSGRNRADLFGMQTCYGRGLSDLNEARASYAMEMVERFSAYVSVGDKGLLDRAAPAPLVQGTYEDVAAEGPALDPAELRLEVPYQGQALWWLEAEALNPGGTAERVRIPAQLGPLFLNLDEQNLYSGLGSTGLASGNTEAEARLAGLCEVLERDALATMPYHPSRAFTLEAADPEVAKLLADLEAGDVHVFFVDMTTEFGVPCYKAVVMGSAGDVNHGMGCGLSGPRALVSALTETPYPFPGPPSAPVPKGLPVRRLEDLPDLATGSAEGDLMVIEGALLANGYRPHYVDLTRKDTGLPVVRAVVPGLEIGTDFDAYARISPRLFRNYLRLFTV